MFMPTCLAADGTAIPFSHPLEWRAALMDNHPMEPKHRFLTASDISTPGKILPQAKYSEDVVTIAEVKSCVSQPGDLSVCGDCLPASQSRNPVSASGTAKSRGVHPSFANCPHPTGRASSTSPSPFSHRGRRGSGSEVPLPVWAAAYT
jgi:hypothetical protein